MVTFDVVFRQVVFSVCTIVRGVCYTMLFYVADVLCTWHNIVQKNGVVYRHLVFAVCKIMRGVCDMMRFYSQTYHVPGITVQKNGVVYRHLTIWRFNLSNHCTI